MVKVTIVSVFRDMKFMTLSGNGKSFVIGEVKEQTKYSCGVHTFETSGGIRLGGKTSFTVVVLNTVNVLGPYTVPVPLEFSGSFSVFWAIRAMRNRRKIMLVCHDGARKLKRRQN